MVGKSETTIYGNFVNNLCGYIVHSTFVRGIV